MSLRLRSLLYTPADRPERYTKAWREGAADAVCADLEDAVAEERKAEARRLTVDALRADPKAASLRAVRVNAADTPHHEADVAAALAAGCDLLVVPKCEDPHVLARLVARVEREAVAGTRVVAILETALGVLRADSLCAVPGIATVCFCAEDLAADVGLTRTPGNMEVLAARQRVALAAAAHRVPALDMVTVDFRDAARLEREAREARAWGYRGKMLIHPAQVAPVHAAFAPTAAELEWARKVVAAAEAGNAARGGVVVVDGRMVDVPVVEQARRLLSDSP
jgi:citrate lyase subunit beta / citryl-CoA lyase